MLTQTTTTVRKDCKKPEKPKQLQNQKIKNKSQYNFSPEQN